VYNGGVVVVVVVVVASGGDSRAQFADYCSEQRRRLGSKSATGYHRQTGTDQPSTRRRAYETYCLLTNSTVTFPAVGHPSAVTGTKLYWLPKRKFQGSTFLVTSS